MQLNTEKRTLAYNFFGTLVSTSQSDRNFQKKTRSAIQGLSRPGGRFKGVAERTWQHRQFLFQPRPPVLWGMDFKCFLFFSQCISGEWGFPIHKSSHLPWWKPSKTYLCLWQSRYVFKISTQNCFLSFSGITGHLEKLYVESSEGVQDSRKHADIRVCKIETSWTLVSYQDRPLVDGLVWKSVTWQGSATGSEPLDSKCSLRWEMITII